MEELRGSLTKQFRRTIKSLGKGMWKKFCAEADKEIEKELERRNTEMMEVWKSMKKKRFAAAKGFIPNSFYNSLTGTELLSQ